MHCLEDLYAGSGTLRTNILECWVCLGRGLKKEWAGTVAD